MQEHVSQRGGIPVRGLHREYTNLMLRVRRAMRLCEVPMLPARTKYVQLYCAVRNMQEAAVHMHEDVAMMMLVLLVDWQDGSPSERLKAATLMLEQKLLTLLGMQFPVQVAD